jgi:hypothetical protein
LKMQGKSRANPQIANLIAVAGSDRAALVQPSTPTPLAGLRLVARARGWGGAGARGFSLPLCQRTSLFFGPEGGAR